jgi:hypothetical protein
MSRYVILCYVMSRYVTLCHTMLCYVTLCHVMSYYVMLCHVISRYLILCYVMSRYVTLCHTMLCYVTLSHVISYYVMLSSEEELPKRKKTFMKTFMKTFWCGRYPTRGYIPGYTTMIYSVNYTQRYKAITTHTHTKNRLDRVPPNFILSVRQLRRRL